MLINTAYPCGVIILALCLRIYESPLHKTIVQRKNTTITPTSHDRYRVEEAKDVQNRLLLEGQ